MPAFVDGTVGLAVSFVVVWLLMPFLIRLLRRRGFVGIDVHKLERPEIPELGGLGIVIGLMTGLFVVGILVILAERSTSCSGLACSIPIKFASNITIGTRSIGGFQLDLPSLLSRIAEIAFVTIPVAGIGLLDDLHPFKGWQKPVLTLGFPAIPFTILAYQYYILRGPLTNPLPKALSLLFTPYMDLPFYGTITLTILFPLIALVAVTIGANAVNMMDVYNGVMPGTVEVVAISLLISAIILGRIEAIYLLLPFIGTLGAYYLFNRYPAKVFSGDIGSLAVGAALVTIALVSRLEIVLLMAMIPFIVNGLNTLLSAGFRERREMKARPTYLTHDGRIAANPDPSAPVPLANLFLLDGARSEKEMIRMYVYTVALSAFLGIVTSLIMLGGELL